MMPAGRLYTGDVVHKRLRPRVHALRYRVFSMLLDVDRIDEVAAGLRFFSRNCFNLLSFYDRDHGLGDGTSVADQARSVLAKAGISCQGGRILLLAYPRVFGYVFNPLSVYYAFDAAGQLAALIYEVNNTFGQRTSYVVRAGAPDGRVFAHAARKQMSVSPFAEQSGRYSFRVTVPGDTLLLAVLLRDTEGPLIKTHFKAEARPLSDGVIARLLLGLPVMTVKVMAAIHYEAAKLWWKGVPLAKWQRSPAYSVSTAEAGKKS